MCVVIIRTARADVHRRLRIPKLFRGRASSTLENLWSGHRGSTGRKFLVLVEDHGSSCGKDLLRKLSLFDGSLFSEVSTSRHTELVDTPVESEDICL